MEKGLTTSHALERLRKIGKNEIVSKKVASPFILFLSQFPNFINGILFIAAIFSFFIRDFIDGSFIIAVLLLNAVFGFIQEYRAEKSLEKLKSFITPLSRVIRDGKELQIPSVELVPQDVVILTEGDRVPADGTLLLNHHLEIDESILSGESLPVIKKDHEPIYSGTLVTKGKGRFRVEKTGMESRFGQIARSLSTVEADKTPLQQRLSTLGKLLSTAAIVISLSLIPMGILQGKELFPVVLIAISIGIAAIPEGLPAVITVALAIGARQMAKKHAIVRKMQSVETLGAVQVVLVDKTGTITQNEMRVKKVSIEHTDNIVDLVKMSILGNTATLVPKTGDGFEIVGDKTDGALLLWAQEQIKDIDSIKNAGRILDEYTFDPTTRTITTIWQEDGKRLALVRGAPEEIIAKSTLSLDQKEKMLALFKEYAKEALRVIAFAKRELSQESTKRSEIEKDLEFIGLIGMYDAPRPQAKQAVIEAKQAGIQTVMVTGDNELTALSIAKEVGLVEKNEEVVTGSELAKMTDSEIKKILPNVRIFARALPQDKLRLVTLYKELGFVVGVTGDGVNDALALKRADVGIAMGETGTDVAKEASDIILTDDNFATLVHAVEEGRRIYNNIKKSITYLLSGNLAELSLVFFASLLGMPNPLLPTQILWINLITDVLPSIALASDQKDPDLLKINPRHPDAPILGKNRLIFIAAIGFGLSFILLLLFNILLQSHSEVFARSVTFNTLIVLHLLIAFLVRGKSLLRVNKFLVFAVVLTLLIQLVATTIPFFQTLLHIQFKQL